MSQTSATPAPDARRPWISLSYRSLGIVTKYALVAMLGLMAILISYQVIARYVFNTPSSVTEELLRYLLIWLGILGAGYCFMERRHLNLPLVIDALTPRNANHFHVFNALITLIFGILLSWGGYNAITSNAATTTPMLHVSVGALYTVLLITGVLTILSQLAELSQLFRMGRENIWSAVGIAVLIAAFVGLAGYFRTSDLYQGWVDNHLELFSVIVLFSAFILFLVAGTSIALGLAFAGIFTLSLQTDLADLFSTMGEKLFGGLDSFGFLALPFFVLAGNIMNEAGIARRLIDLAMIIGRRIPGSLWQTNVIANMLFGTLSGSGIAAATAIGGIVTPIAREKGYDMAVTTAVNAASAPTGMLIPPSGALIVYSLITGGSASIVALFLAGYLPGIIMGLAVMIGAYFYARSLNYPVDKSPLVVSEVWRAVWSALPSISLVFVVIGGIIGGAFTATEGAGVAVLYSFILALVYRKLTLQGIVKILSDTAISTGVIMFLIACSGLMSWSMTFASIPDTIGQYLTTVSDNKYVILLIINIALLIVGVFMDMAPAQLIFTPILYPIVTGLGVDPVHFGIIMTYNLSVGLVTPPVGTVLFVSCSLTGEKITRVTRVFLPIFALQVIGLLIVTYVPWLSLALPRALGL